TIATTNSFNEVVLWNVQASWPIGPPAPGEKPVFSPDGKLLAVFDGHSRTVVLRDGTTGQMMGEPLTGFPELVTSLAFSYDSRTLAAGSLDLKEPKGGSISLWDVTARRAIGESWRTNDARINDLAFNPDSNVLVSAGEGTVFWDMNPNS